MNAVERPTLDREGGFTLIELVVTISILSTITVGLTAVVLSYFKTTVDTNARLTESHDVQFASAYWQRDVSSVGVRDSTYDPDPTIHGFALNQSVWIAGGSCALSGAAAGADPVITLGWSEYTSPDPDDPPATVKVTWAYLDHALYRVRCGSLPEVLQVADSLSARPLPSCVQAGGGTSCTGSRANVPVKVSLALEVFDRDAHAHASYTAKLSGERRQS